MSAPPQQSQGEETNISAAPNPSPPTLEKHIDTLYTLANNFWEKNKKKGEINVRDSPLSSFLSQVKNTKIITTNEYGNKKVTVHESHRDVNMDYLPLGDKKTQRVNPSLQV